MSEPVLEWEKLAVKRGTTNDKHDAGNVIATANDKIIVGSEDANRQYELPKTSIERFNGSEAISEHTACRIE